MCPGSEQPGVESQYEASAHPECREGEIMERIADPVEQAICSSDSLVVMTLRRVTQRDLELLKCVGTLYPHKTSMMPPAVSREVRMRSSRFLHPSQCAHAKWHKSSPGGILWQRWDVGLFKRR